MAAQQGVVPFITKATFRSYLLSCWTQNPADNIRREVVKIQHRASRPADAYHLTIKQEGPRIRQGTIETYLANQQFIRHEVSLEAGLAAGGYRQFSRVSQDG